MSGQKSIQLVGKGLPVFLVEGGWPAGIHSTSPQLVHEISHGQPLFDIFFGIKFSPRVQGVAAFTDHL